MKFKKMRLLAVSLAAVLFATSIASADVYAANTGNAQSTEVSTDETTVDIGESSFAVGDVDTADEDVNDGQNTSTDSADDSIYGDVVADIVSSNDIDPEIDLVGEEDKLNYLYLETKYLDTSVSNNGIATENILASYGDEETEIIEATLTIRNYDTGETFDVFSDEGLYNLIMFSVDFTNADQGIYEIESASFTTADGDVAEINIADTGMNKIYFGVDELFEEGAEKVEAKDPEIEMQIVDMSDGEIVGTDTTAVTEAVEGALESAEENLDILSGENKSTSLSDYVGETLGTVAGDTMNGGKYVVVLDPGHDATHAGARANGLNEEDLTLKIANYCKAELQTYSNVTVYMTRTSAACPNGGDSTTDNAKRVEYAASVGADIYVSIHLNSGSASASGAEVYYPNSNYNSTIGSRGANLATLIERQLVALGLGNRGIQIRNSGDGTTYPDGSLADYYGVIRRSKLAGFPAVIVEHAFVSNTNDANFLKSEANLKKLGVADATGIANYLGLSQAIEVKSNAPSIVSNDNVNGTATVRVTGVTPYASVSFVKFAVWTAANGQDDLKWYDAVHKGNGIYEATIDIANHKREAGVYNIHVYATDVKKGSHYLGAVTASFTKVSPSATGINVSKSSDEKYITLTATDVKGVSTLQFAVWSNTNGQDDLMWYSATRNQTAADKANGTYTFTATVPAANHKGQTGTYQVHAYGYNGYDGTSFVKATTFELTPPHATRVYTNNIKAAEGSFQVRLDDVLAPAGVSTIKVAVWSLGDQSNLSWYTAVLDTSHKGQDGKNNDYVVNVNLANHKYLYGNYTAHCYIYDNNNALNVQATSVSVTQPTPKISVASDSTEANYTIKLENTAWSGGIKNINVAVWSNANGQDDLTWYHANNQGNGTWSVNVPIKNHGSSGVYQVHAYVETMAGALAFLTSTSFNVTDVSVGKVEAVNVNDSTGTFDVYVRNVISKSGIDKIKVAVWSKDNQSNLKWYDAVRVDANNNGRFDSGENDYKIVVNISDHSFEYGNYKIHAYVYANNGVNKVVGGGATLTVPKATVSAVVNEAQTTGTVFISGVGYPGGVHGVNIAVWSNVNGQDDLIWYQATNKGNGKWSADVDIARHGAAGSYQVHAYVVDALGQIHFIGNTSFEIKGISAQISSSIVKSGSADFMDSQFDVTIKITSIPSGLKNVKVAVWSTVNQSDIKWYELTDANKDGAGNYKFRVDIKDHYNNMGVYQIHAYMTGNNMVSTVVGTTAKIEAPVAHIVASTSQNQSITTIKVSDAKWVSGIRGLKYAVWSDENGQDDMRWYDATKDATGTWISHISTSNHRTAGGYSVHAYIVDQDGNMHWISAGGYNITGPRATSVSVTNRDENNGRFSVTISGVSGPQTIKSVKVAVWSVINGQDDMTWYSASNQGNGTYSAEVDIRNHSVGLGAYNCHVYVVDDNEITVFGGATATSMNVYVSDGYYPIMGASSITVDQMVRYYNSKATYPSYYAGSDAPDIRTFCQMYLDECNAEGVKAEVAFCQAMKETGFLKFGGDVQISQYNFAGLGATGGGARGASFSNVRTGIRAQVQHLKAYASTSGLNNPCVDSRYQYVTKGCAIYVQWLGQKENPQGKGWATANRYGYSIVNDYICKLRSM